MAATVYRRAAAAALAAAVAALAAGCGDVGAREAREESHPLMRRALARKRANDLEGATAAFHEALERNPALARAHLDLGQLYDQGPRPDPLRAIHHYSRYLELRPGADKREMVEGLIRDARISFAATMRPPPAEAYETIASLQREVERLRAEVGRREGRVAAPPPAVPAAPPPAPPSAAPRRRRRGRPPRCRRRRPRRRPARRPRTSSSPATPSRASPPRSTGTATPGRASRRPTGPPCPIRPG